MILRSPSQQRTICFLWAEFTGISPPLSFQGTATLLFGVVSGLRHRTFSIFKFGKAVTHSQICTEKNLLLCAVSLTLAQFSLRGVSCKITRGPPTAPQQSTQIPSEFNKDHYCLWQEKLWWGRDSFHPSKGKLWDRVSYLSQGKGKDFLICPAEMEGLYSLPIFTPLRKKQTLTYLYFIMSKNHLSQKIWENLQW